jgi:hypothetical protein
VNFSSKVSSEGIAAIFLLKINIPKITPTTAIIGNIGLNGAVLAKLASKNKWSLLIRSATTLNNTIALQKDKWIVWVIFNFIYV